MVPNIKFWNTIRYWQSLSLVFLLFSQFIQKYDILLFLFSFSFDCCSIHSKTPTLPVGYADRVRNFWTTLYDELQSSKSVGSKDLPPMTTTDKESNKFLIKYQCSMDRSPRKNQRVRKSEAIHNYCTCIRNITHRASLWTMVDTLFFSGSCENNTNNTNSNDDDNENKKSLCNRQRRRRRPSCLVV